MSFFLIQEMRFDFMSCITGGNMHHKRMQKLCNMSCYDIFKWISDF